MIVRSVRRDELGCGNAVFCLFYTLLFIVRNFSKRACAQASRPNAQLSIAELREIYKRACDLTKDEPRLNIREAEKTITLLYLHTVHSTHKISSTRHITPLTLLKSSTSGLGFFGISRDPWDGCTQIRMWVQIYLLDGVVIFFRRIGMVWFWFGLRLRMCRYLFC